MPVRREDCLDVSKVEPRPMNNGYAPGLEYQELTVNDKTGGDHLVVSVPAGWSQDKTGYVTAGQDIYILEGDLSIGDDRLTNSCYTYIPEGVVFGPMSSEQGCRMLLYHNKPHQFVEASESVADADADKAIAPVKTWRLAWEDPMKTVVKKSTYFDPNTGKPTRPPGVLTKMLRYDEETKETVYLTQISAGFVDPGTETHPHDECLYVIAGELYVGHTYDHKKQDVKEDLEFTKDFYIGRPPGIRHGPVCTQSGALFLLYQSDKYTGIFDTVDDWEERVSNYLERRPYI